MQLTKLNLNFNNRLHSVTAPLTCPYCGKVVELTERNSTMMAFSKNQEKYKEYDVKVLKKYLDIFLKLIDTDYSINHPSVSRQN